MIALKSSRYKHKLISYKRTDVFRFNKVVFPDRKGNTVFLTNYFNNIYKQYEVISEPLPNGNYLLKVTDVDNVGNENVGIQKSVSITYFPLPPANVLATLNGNTVTFTWTTSADGVPSGGYVLYGNGGTGGNIDRTTVLATFLGSVNSGNYVAANGNWSFVLEAINNGIQSNSLYLVSLMIPITTTVPPKVGTSGSNPLGVTGLMLSPVSVGCVSVSFLWLYGTGADTFNVYTDGGTGVMNYVTPAFTFARQSNLIQYYTTSQLSFIDGPTTFQFVVRAQLNGVEEKNTDIYSISIDGKAPDLSQNVVVDTIF